MLNLKAVKIIGAVASLVGVGATLASNWAGGKQQEAKIAEEVAKALAKTNEES